MLNVIKRRLTAPLVISLLALFAALGGVAGALPGKNHVNSGDIKNNSVKSADIKNDSVTGADVDESTLKLPSSAVSRTTFGAEVNDGGSIVNATLSGTTSRKAGSNTFVVTFPRSVVNCVVVGSGLFDGSATAIRSGTGSPNDVIGSTASGTGMNFIVTCPS